MPRYIDSEILWKKLHEAGGCGAEKGSWADGWDKAIDEAIRLLDEMPTADVVEVVRCEDCKYYYTHYHHCRKFSAIRACDNYCSFAERKEQP